MKSIFKIFEELKNESQNIRDGFIIASIPEIKFHKIGITHDDQPIFFIKCENNTISKTIDTNLEFISVQFNRQCQLINKNNKIEDGIYTIISLKPQAEHLHEYFLKVVYLLISSISDKPNLKNLRIEIDKLINLFSKFSKPPLKTIQGLWAELLVIQKSNNPAYLIQAWHSNAADKYDFNDGIDKLEIKSTTRNRRIHNFSLEQLTPNIGSKLLVVSIFTNETGKGISILDLVEMIEKKVLDNNMIFRLNELIALTLGNEYEKSLDVFFDYQSAVDSMRYYNCVDIPTILAKDIPSNILNVRFDCDLTDVDNIKNCSFKSQLFNLLFW